jgi:hypothetical protein
MPTTSSLNNASWPEALDRFREPASLCRVGDYRSAVKVCLRQRRETGRIRIELGYALVKTGRSRLGIQCCLSLLGQERALDAQCTKIITEALKHYRPKVDEIKQVGHFISASKLTPGMVAMIGSQIDPAEACNYFFESCIDLYSFSDNQIKLTQAYTAKLRGDELTALSIAQDLVASDSSARDACLLAAELLLSKDFIYEARKFACLALKNDPTSIAALELVGLSLYKQARWKATRRIFAKIHEQTHDDISLINSIITLPLLALSQRELPQAVQGFKQLERLLEDPPPLLGIVESMQRCSSPLPSEFYLPYEGPVPVRKNFELIRGFQRLSAQSILSEIVRHHQHGATRDLGQQAPGDVTRKLKIAFISRFFSYHSNLVAHFGLIKHLSRQRFHITIIHRSGAAKDNSHNEINELADKVLYLADELGESCSLIKKLDLDILFFTDIGMNPWDSILAMPHLARHQVTSWGLPHTTGVQEIDFYLRSSIFADCEDQAEYTERLIDLPGYIGYFSHADAKLSNASRDYFLIPPDRFLVGCLQSLHKIHPEFDSYLEQIAKIDASILIIISPSEGDQLMKDFLRRLKKSAPTAYQQLCIVQRTSLDDFFSLNTILDLNLDTINYGAGISFIQTAWCGPPYVTQHSNLVRASTVSRSYRYAGVKNPPIAHSQAEYVELVRYYFNHRTELARLRAEIQAKAEGSIYDNQDYVRSCEDFFRNLFGHGNDLHSFVEKNTSTA